MLRIRNKSFGSGLGSGLKLVSDSDPDPNPDSIPGFESGSESLKLYSGREPFCEKTSALRSTWTTVSILLSPALLPLQPQCLVIQPAPVENHPATNFCFIMSRLLNLCIFKMCATKRVKKEQSIDVFMFIPALLNPSRQFVYMRGANKKCRGTLLQTILECRLAGHQNTVY